MTRQEQLSQWHDAPRTLDIAAIKTKKPMMTGSIQSTYSALTKLKKCWFWWVNMMTGDSPNTCEPRYCQQCHPYKVLPREATTPLYNWVVEHLQQWNMFYNLKSKDVSWECREWSRAIWNMKNMCTTHWQVGKIDQLHNLHVTNMSTCDFTNINTFQNKPCHHIFFQLRIWRIFPRFHQN